MTLPATPRRSPVYIGNGVATAFAFTFKVFATTDVQVLRTNADGSISTLVPGSDYSVMLNADQDTTPGGTIAYPLSGSPLPSPLSLVILGNLPYDQTLSLPGGGNFNPRAIERNLDRMTMQIQQLADKAVSAITVPTGESVPSLPVASARAGYLLGFNGSGDPVAVAATSGSAAALALDLATGNNVSKGAGQVGFLNATAYGFGTVGKKLKERFSVFDKLTALEIADVQAGTRALNVTSNVQAAIAAAAANTDRQTELIFPQGDYAVSTLDFSACKNVTIICQGAVYITGVTAATNYIVKMAGTGSADAPRRNTIEGTLSIQTVLSSYQSGFYGRWIIDGRMNLSVSGAFSVAAVDLDVCFDNDWPWLSASNTTVNVPVILFGQNNMNANRMRIRVAGAGIASGQTGLVLAGSSNDIFGDVSAVQTAVNLDTVRGTRLQLYAEVVGTSIACTAGISRGVSIIGGTYEVASNSTAFNFSGGGSLQGLSISAVRFVGVSAGVNRQAINWGSAAYGVNLFSYDTEGIDTVFSGTIRGASGGLIDQFLGAVRHRSNGTASWLAGWGDTLQTQNIAGAGTVNVDASLGNEVVLTVSTAGAQTIAAPTNPLTGQHLTYVWRNTSGGALGAFTWNAIFKLAAWTSPATAYSRSITFRYDGTNWIERSRTPADVPN